MTIKSCRTILALAVLALVSACASNNPIPLDHTRAGSLKTIGVVTPDMPAGAVSYIAATPGRSFGLIGALIDVGMQANREEKLKAMLDGQKFAADTVFIDRLTEALKAQGYEVVMVPVKREKAREFLTKYPTAADTKVDAYLDVVYGSYGYMAAGTGDSAPYRPFMYLRCQLVRAGDSSVLMQDWVTYNPINEGGAKTVTLSPDPAYAFTTSDDMEADPVKVAEGLRVALGQTAGAVGQLLR